MGLKLPRINGGGVVTFWRCWRTQFLVRISENSPSTYVPSEMYMYASMVHCASKERSAPDSLHLSMVSHRDWKLVRKVGEGSFGQVFAAVNNKTGGLFAVKSVWLNGHGDQTHKVVADEAEIGLLSKLDHQNIVKYLGSHVDEDYFYMYMEFVAGGSLNDTSGIPRGWPSGRSFFNQNYNNLEIFFIPLFCSSEKQKG